MPTVCALFMGVPIITTSETLSFYRYPKVKANPASDLKKPMDLQSNAWLKSLQRLDLLNNFTICVYALYILETANQLRILTINTLNDVHQLKWTTKSSEVININMLLWIVGVIENKKRTKLILIRIENTILNIVKGLYDNDELVIDVPNFSDLSKIPTKKTLRFNTKHRRNYLTIIIYMLSKIYKNLVSNTSCTARELYYGDTLLFKHDSILRKALINICYLLNTKSWELGITLTSKGLVAGNLIIYMHDGKIIDCSKTNEGIQIPQDVLEIEHFKSKAKYILIIEKNASFQKIINEGLLKRNKCSFIIITGKGFPDINTRLFVKQLSCKLNISVLVLVDANPFGIEIMCVYKFGSNTMSHQNDSLSVPMIQWLGVYPSEIASLNLPCISLTNLDQARIISLLKRSYINSNSKLLEQIRILHQLNKKAEIESLTTVTETYLTKLTSIKTLAGLHTNHSVNAYDLTKLKRNQKRRTCTK